MSRFAKRSLKFIRLSSASRWLLAAAWVVLLIVRIIQSVLPFRVLRRIGGVGERLHWSPADEADLAWAITAAAGYVPGANCLTQALAFQVLHGDANIQVRYGVARTPCGRIAAHAWIESGGKAILGATAPGAFSPLDSKRSE
jgi:hypothetical protein